MTDAGLAPFGWVFATSAARSVNQGRGARTELARLSSGSSLPPVLARYDLAPSAWPVRVEVMERHPGSAQALVPLDASAGLVVVAPDDPDGRPDIAAARAFIATAETPYLYTVGIWHAPLFAIGRPGSFLMMMHESGTPADCETVALSRAIEVHPALTASCDEGTT